MGRKAAALTCLNLFVVLAVAGYAYETKIRDPSRLPLDVTFFESQPSIDGRIDEAIWKEATRLKDFYQTQPGDNTLPSFPTEVLLGYNQQFLFIAIQASDRPDKIRATLTKRDDVSNDDYIAIYLDTFHDQRKAYLLMFNPLGMQQDGIYLEDGKTDYSVDIVMNSKGTLIENGYTIEISIPFHSLRYQTSKQKRWGIHVLRVIKHLDEENSWMPLSRDKTTVSGSEETKAKFLAQAGEITGLEGVKRGRVLEFIPVMTPSETGRRLGPLGSAKTNPQLADSKRFQNQPIDLDFGMTAKFSLTPAVALTSALNPDFAEVEADQPQITANQRFPLFFDEKRPFFLEAIEIFQTPIQAVHTRTIIDPNGAAKLSGKHGHTTFGLMAASDEAPGNFSEEEKTDPGLERFIDKNAYSMLFRVRRDIADQSNFGFLATSYNFVEKHNHLVGFDGRLNIRSNSFLTFQFLGTNSRRFFYDPDTDQNKYRTGNGLGYYGQFNRTGRHLNVQVTGQGYTADYRADLGFIQRTNTNRWNASVRYNSEPKNDGKLISWSALHVSLAQFDWQGRMQYAYHFPQVFFNFKRQTFLNLYGYCDYVRLFEEEFGPKRSPARQGAFSGSPERSTDYAGFAIQAGTAPSKKYSFTVYIDNSWNNLDFDFGAGPKFPRVSPAALADPDASLDPGPGRSKYASVTATYQPAEALKLAVDFTKSSLVRNDTKLPAFEQNLYSLRANYSFTRFTFARARIDYDSLTASIRGQFLAGWTPNPGTSLYLGYNEDFNYNGYDPFTNRYEQGLHRNTRTFFVKLSYLFRYGL
ncbi:carbohydrate binding family 9 domain-containing protein [bacterium]|nr:carbohydrate binding family 9 domain-containing protein [bacterium]